MNKLSRLLLNRKDGSASDIEEEQDSSDSIEISISNIEKNLLNWNIPKKDIKTIYKIGSINYFQGYFIKTTEITLPVVKDHQNIQLFSEKPIRE